MNAISVIVLLLTVAFAFGSIVYIIKANKEFNRKMDEIRSQASVKLSIPSLAPAPAPSMVF